MANICDVQRRFSLFLPSEPSELLGTLRYTSEHADNDMTLCSGLRNSIIKNPIFWTSQICGRIFSDVLRRPGTLTIYHIWVVFSSCLEIFYLPLIHFFASNHKELKNVAQIPFFSSIMNISWRRRTSQILYRYLRHMTNICDVQK